MKPHNEILIFEHKQHSQILTKMKTSSFREGKEYKIFSSIGLLQYSGHQVKDIHAHTIHKQTLYTTQTPLT